MAKKSSRFGFTPQEHRISALPSTLAGISVLAILVYHGVVFSPEGAMRSLELLGLGALGILYLSVLDLYIIPSLSFNKSYGWMNAIITSVGLVALTLVSAEPLDIYLGVLLVLSTSTSSIISERGQSYTLIFVVTIMTLLIRRAYIVTLQEWTFHLGMAVISLIMFETIWRLKKLSRDHIRRVETITDFSRQITSTLNTKQVMALLNAAFQNAVEADTYFVGIREGNEMRLELIYDDGQFYENQSVKLDGTISGWVLNNQQSLFLPDLRKEVELPGVRLVLVGKHKTNLSWMGVPMRGSMVDGVIAIGSYRPNAFDRADLELLSNLAQHAALAIDNTYRHAQVELQARLDSLTGVYNHGYFLKLLGDQIDQAARENQPLSLIMLDIDHFKQYNDSFGHLVGDEVLTALCGAIQQHIKITDSVGRWGGEEFAISLPNVNMEQALQVAGRIQGTMSILTIKNNEQESIPVPTISQGIAVFPADATEVIKLIDLADNRLYVAKSRGRDQIEPDPGKTQAANP
jgi:diguanylate cyclase (GGDEF)-like protein